MLTNTLPSLFNNYIINVTNEYKTRACDHDAAIYPTELQGTCSSIKIAAAYFWNLIPIEIRKVNYSRYSFKSKVRNWLISKYDL